MQDERNAADEPYRPDPPDSAPLADPPGDDELPDPGAEPPDEDSLPAQDDDVPDDLRLGGAIDPRFTEAE